MHVHFLGIGGTLMGNLALLAKSSGHRVSGSEDHDVYPPMSDVLADAGIAVLKGFDPAHFRPAPDLVVIGNAGLPRGHPAIEFILNNGFRYTSGAAWLGEHVLFGRHVIAVSGTHGKTTTTSMVAWILAANGVDPGYLIGGVPFNLPASSQLGTGTPFVVEADEYDTSYFDRRSKFVHYRPNTLVINNLEFDHADIFDDLAAIQLQFHHLLRAVPSDGRIIVPNDTEAIEQVLKMGCWTPVSQIRSRPARRPRTGTIAEFVDTWRAEDQASDGSSFTVTRNEQPVGTVAWSLIGEHNVHNALAAIAATTHVDVAPQAAIEALCDFTSVRRRLELIAETSSTRIYDDFAHHPTAIRTTLQGLRDQVGSAEIIAVIEPRSHTMSLGALREELARCCAAADRAIWFRGPNLQWDLGEVIQASVIPATVEDRVEALADKLIEMARAPAESDRKTHVLIMSNGSFGGLAGVLRNTLS